MSARKCKEFDSREASMKVRLASLRFCSCLDLLQACRGCGQIVALLSASDSCGDAVSDDPNSSREWHVERIQISMARCMNAMLLDG